MAVPPFPTSTFTTPHGLIYHYVYIPPRISIPNSTILILHGFPSIPTDFTSQITHLTHLNHGVLAPTLLGYHPTSTPQSPHHYALKSQCDDLIALLSHLHITTSIHDIGHDWGATLLSRLSYYYPHRLAKLAYLAIAPPPLGQPFDLDFVNKLSENLGDEAFGYQKFFIDDVQYAQQLLEANHDRMEMLMFAEGSQNLWRDYFGSIGGLENWWKAEGDLPKDAKMIQGVTEEDLSRRREVFCPGKDDEVENGEFGRGYAGPLMWYVSHNQILNLGDERQEENDWKRWKSDHDILLVLCDKDPIAPPSMHIGMAQSYVRDVRKQLRVAHLLSGHFVMYERSWELNKLLEDFLH